MEFHGYGYFECPCGNLSRYIASTPQKAPPGHRCSRCIAKAQDEHRQDVIERVRAVARRHYLGGKDVELTCTLGKRDVKCAFLDDVELEFKTKIAPEVRGRLHLVRQLVEHLLKADAPPEVDGASGDSRASSAASDSRGNSLSSNEVFKLVRTLLSTNHGIDETEITPYADLQEDLHLEKIDVVEHVSVLEAGLKLRVNLSDVEIERMRTVGDLVECVVRKLRVTEEAPRRNGAKLKTSDKQDADRPAETERLNNVLDSLRAEIEQGNFQGLARWLRDGDHCGDLEIRQAAGFVEGVLQRSPELVHKFLTVMEHHCANADARALKNLEYLVAIIAHPEVQKVAVREILKNARDEKREMIRAGGAVGVAAIVSAAVLGGLALIAKRFAPDRRGPIKRAWDDIQDIRKERQ